MSDTTTSRNDQSFPWLAVLATAAVGVLALAAAKKIHDAKSAGTQGVDSWLKMCDQAADALDKQLSGVVSQSA